MLLKDLNLHGKENVKWEKHVKNLIGKNSLNLHLTIPNLAVTENKCELDDEEMCAMCGEYCAVKIAKGDF